jgi:hypothetical protein
VDTICERAKNDVPNAVGRFDRLMNCRVRTADLF